MGLFGGFNPLKAITRAVGIPDKARQTAIDIFPVLTLTSGELPSYLHGIGGGHHPPQPRPQPSLVRVPNQPTTYQQPYYGGGGFPTYDPYSSVQPYNPLGGPASWDYSMGSSTYLVQPSPVYSESQTRPAWEDLALTVLPLFL